VSDTTTATTFRVTIPDAGSFVADDAVSGAPISVLPITPSAYPVVSGLARIVADARELDVAGVAGSPMNAARGQAGVPFLGLSIVNPGSGAIGPDIRLSRFGVELVDSTGATIANPSRVLARIRVRAGSQVVCDRAVDASEDSTMALTLSPVVALPLNQAMSISITADIDGSADLGRVRLRVADSTSFVARNANSGATMPAILATHPIDGAVVTVVARADTLVVQGQSRFPAGMPVGSTDVDAITVTLEHPGAALTSRVRVDTLAFDCRDAANAAQIPGAFLDRIRVLLGATEIGIVTNLPSTPTTVAIPITGLTLDPGQRVTLDIRVNVEVSAPTGLFAMTLGAGGFVCRDENLGTPIAVRSDSGPGFPFTSGVTQLEAPARELVASFVEEMPAVLAADGNPVPVAKLTLTNTASSGTIRVDHLDVLASDPRNNALATGDAVSRIQAWVGDSLWADSGDLLVGAMTARATAMTPLALDPHAPITIELRAIPRSGAPIGPFRLGLRSDGIGVIQPTSPLLAVAVVAGEGQAFPFWTLAGGPTALTLKGSYSNFPNPFAAGRQSSTFAFYLKSPARVTLELWTLRGDRVRTLLSGSSLGAGLHQEIGWDGKNGRGDTVVSGAYVAEIRATYDDGSEERERRKVAVVR